MILKTKFFKAPNAVFDNPDLGLSRYDKLVYLYLCRCSNQGADAFPGYSGIARKCGISRATARRAVKSLEDKGFITATRRPKSNHDNESNLYQVNLLPSITGTPPLVKQGYQSSAQVIPYKEPLKNNQPIKDTTVDGSNKPKLIKERIKEHLLIHGSSPLKAIAEGTGINEGYISAHLHDGNELFVYYPEKQGWGLKDKTPITAEGSPALKGKDDSPESHPGASAKVLPLPPNIMRTLEERRAKQNIEAGVR